MPADSAVAGVSGDAVLRSTLDAQDRQHTGHAAQEHSVTLVAAETQDPPALATGTTAPQALPASAPRVRARIVNRPGYVDVKVQSMHQLQRRMRRIGS